MSIVKGKNLEKPDGTRGNYYRVQVFVDGKIKVKFFNITEYGEKKAKQLAMEWYKANKS